MMRSKILAWLVVGAALMAPLAISAPTLAAEGPSTPQVEALRAKVEANERNVDTVRSDVQLMLWPVGILLAVLTLGGLLSVVFSIRDQRRVTQLHELAVTGETAAQRRSEESFSSFLSESQKTLTLVNDTLTLAKESTDRAAHAMQVNAEARVNAIEGRAEALMLRAFDSGEFESILDELELRNDLGRIAGDLGGLEGYLELQSMPLPPHCRFVKAIDLFLKDDTRGALELLQRAEQEARPGDLHRFTLYWIGYMQLTIGEYESARRKFHDDEGGLRTEDREHHQLERMELEAEFFQAANELERHGPSTPNERLRKTQELIGKLDNLARRVAASDNARKSRTSHEVARTRADALSWVAYDLAAAGARLREEDLEAGSAAEQPADDAAEGVIRAWALRRAYEVCDAQHQRDFYLEFTRAECAKTLGLSGARAAFEEVTRMLVAEAGKHRETRREAELAQVAAICHAQLGSMPLDTEAAQGEHRNAATGSASKAAETARSLSHTEVTIFSALRRHNISPEAFIREVSDLIGAGTAGGQANGVQTS
jgi:hypothetical protein